AHRIPTVDGVSDAVTALDNDVNKAGGKYYQTLRTSEHAADINDRINRIKNSLAAAEARAALPAEVRTQVEQDAADAGVNPDAYVLAMQRLGFDARIEAGQFRYKMRAEDNAKAVEEIKAEAKDEIVKPEEAVTPVEPAPVEPVTPVEPEVTPEQVTPPAVTTPTVESIVGMQWAGQGEGAQRVKGVNDLTKDEALAYAQALRDAGVKIDPTYADESLGVIKSKLWVAIQEAKPKPEAPAAALDTNQMQRLADANALIIRAGAETKSNPAQARSRLTEAEEIMPEFNDYPQTPELQKVRDNYHQVRQDLENQERIAAVVPADVRDRVVTHAGAADIGPVDYWNAIGSLGITIARNEQGELVGGRVGYRKDGKVISAKDVRKAVQDGVKNGGEAEPRVRSRGITPPAPVAPQAVESPEAQLYRETAEQAILGIRTDPLSGATRLSYALEELEGTVSSTLRSGKVPTEVSVALELGEMLNQDGSIARDYDGTPVGILSHVNGAPDLGKHEGGTALKRATFEVFKEIADAINNMYPFADVQFLLQGSKGVEIKVLGSGIDSTRIQEQVNGALQGIDGRIAKRTQELLAGKIEGTIPARFTVRSGLATQEINAQETYMIRRALMDSRFKSVAAANADSVLRPGATDVRAYDPEIDAWINQNHPDVYTQEQTPNMQDEAGDYADASKAYRENPRPDNLEELKRTSDAVVRKSQSDPRTGLRVYSYGAAEFVQGQTTETEVIKGGGEEIGIVAQHGAANFDGDKFTDYNRHTMRLEYLVGEDRANLGSHADKNGIVFMARTIDDTIKFEGLSAQSLDSARKKIKAGQVGYYDADQWVQIESQVERSELESMAQQARAETDTVEAAVDRLHEMIKERTKIEPKVLTGTFGYVGQEAAAGLAQIAEVEVDAKVKKAIEEAVSTAVAEEGLSGASLEARVNSELDNKGLTEAEATVAKSKVAGVLRTIRGQALGLSDELVTTGKEVFGRNAIVEATSITLDNKGQIKYIDIKVYKDNPIKEDETIVFERTLGRDKEGKLSIVYGTTAYPIDIAAKALEYGEITKQKLAEC
ncbi:hypothetical protein ACFLZ6_01915, partial [Nanoarchaeota archaeon]